MERKLVLEKSKEKNLKSITAEQTVYKLQSDCLFCFAAFRRQILAVEIMDRYDMIEK